jgi:cytochrome b561
MTTSTTPSLRYTPTAKTLHWITAVLVLANIPGGILLGVLPDGPVKDTLYDLHRSTGFVILVVVLVRLAWRLTQGAPPPEPGLSKAQVGVSHAVHWTLYLLLLVMPILGWTGANAYGATVSIYWLFDLPNLLAKNEPLSDTLLGWHATLGLITAGLVSLHIAAALYHRFVRHDGVLARMTRDGNR